MINICLAIVVSVLCCGRSIAETEVITIGSGNTVGIYYSTSSAVAKLFNRKLSDYKQLADTVVSEGSVENINEVIAGDVDFGLAQANLLDKGFKGTGPWSGNPQKELRAVLTLYTEDLTLIAAEDAKIYAMSDLRGKRVSVGAAGSSDASYVKDIMLLDGIRLTDVTIVEESANRSQDLLADHKIDAYFFSVGHPSFSVREASSGKRKVRLVPLNESLIDFGVTSNALLSAVSIPIDYYPEIGNEKPVPTLGVSTMLFTHKDMADETVYRMVKEMMENLDLFRRQHPALRALDEKEMARSIALPLHPGAKRYFIEMGLRP